MNYPFKLLGLLVPAIIFWKRGAFARYFHNCSCFLTLLEIICCTQSRKYFILNLLNFPNSRWQCLVSGSGSTQSWPSSRWQSRPLPTENMNWETIHPGPALQSYHANWNMSHPSTKTHRHIVTQLHSHTLLQCYSPALSVQSHIGLQMEMRQWTKT